MAFKNEYFESIKEKKNKLTLNELALSVLPVVNDNEKIISDNETTL